MLNLLYRFAILSLFWGLSALPAWASEGGSSVSLSPYVLTQVAGIPITNAMATSWVVSLVFILGIRLLVGVPQMVPNLFQSLMEEFVDYFRNMVGLIVGREGTPKVLPVLMTFFCFILVNNLSGLFPGVGAFGFYDEHGHLVYWMRPGNADMNMTLALSLVYFVVWLYFVLRYQGLGHFMAHVFENKADKREVPAVVYYALFPLFFIVGGLELFSILVRPASLAFRLFGNVFGGESLISSSLSSPLGWIIPVPFYLLEVLISVVQATVFTLLVAVYIGLLFDSNDTKEEEQGSLAPRTPDSKPA